MVRRLAALTLLVAALVPAATLGQPPVVERTWPAEWPMDPAPLTGPGFPPLPPPLPAAAPATAAGAAILATLDDVRETLRETRYQHRLVVRPRRGRYFWDCSGFVSWAVRRATRVAGRSIRRPRSTARHLHDLIRRERPGWREVERIEDARPGDIFAWRTPAGSPSRHTGHCGVLLEQPRRVPGLRNGWAVRVADSVVGPHQEDTRPRGGTEGGFGSGVFVFLADDEGHATHYGWHGTLTRGYMRTRVRFGRLLR